MMHHFAGIVLIVVVAATIFSWGYYVLCLVGSVSFLRERRAEHSAQDETKFPPVSILKPLKGADPEMYESFRSHCEQDYPAYEILFCVSDPQDPAVASVERLRQEFPNANLQLIVPRQTQGANVKVSNLAQAVPMAHHQVLVVNDSDIRVPPDYLRRVTGPLADENTGMVTSLYRGVPESTLGSRLESLGISTDFCAGVLAARQMEGGIRFGLGSTLSFRRADLAKIGGFEAIVDYLADDYELGKRISDLGLKVRLSQVVVETHLPAYTLREFYEHQMRWARGVRDSRPGGYLGLGLTFGTIWSSFALILAHGAGWAWALFALTAGMRVAVAWIVGSIVLGDAYVLRLLWLVPLRDFAAFAVWISSFFGQTVIWRGTRFRLDHGRLKPIHSP